MDLHAELARAKLMQIATVHEGNPWICTVYFAVHHGAFYWLSLPTRQHSQDIAKNPRIALAIALKHDKPVVGLQIDGDSTVVTDPAEVEAALAPYVAKYGQGGQFVERFLAGENQHLLYKCVPRKAMLFDEYYRPNEPYREVTTRFVGLG